ncbi:hypothetical protein HYH03_012069 [Edaphochlamys debaryana]|uniref:Uncharacterized protein n=1 Tax=Edaphochlamys debaryana TaxID=47281 RepID=A0A836BUW3_9CHLO|nr:hypothetical protein HYH03_012069 [Edaphochlamys debaryana]|eukprot:KAG2489432.1 hypothetical protein HYH03_012069 [Edaphochlamys debaryana]
MELGQLAEALQTVHALLIGPNAGSRARALAADGSFAARLVTCMVVGTTWLCRLSELTEVQRQLAMEALAVVTNTAHALDASMRHSVAAAASAVAFARALLRTHTLQRLSRFCAAATAYLQGVAAALEAPVAAEAAPQEACVWGCVKALGMVPALISNFATLARTATQASLAPPPPADLAPQREWRRLEVAKRVLVSEFASHLGASGVFEHLARALVTAGLAASAAMNADAEDLQLPLDVAAPLCFEAVLCNISCVVQLCQAVLPDAAATLRGAMSGPCFRHLVLSAGLAALCIADGGPSHGLPRSLLDGLPVRGNAQATSSSGAQDVRVMEQEGEPAWLSGEIFDVLIVSLGPGPRPVPLLPFMGPRAAVSLLLRVGRLALASFRAWCQADPTAAAGEFDFLLGPPWAMEQVPQLWACMRNVDVLLPPPAGSGWAETALVERWRLAVGAVEHLTPWLEGADRDALAGLIAEPLAQGELVSPDGSLPAGASPTVAAALTAGLVPALANLARRALEGQRDAGLLIKVITYCGPESSVLGRLLAYGQPAETAGFLVSIAESLRRCRVSPPPCNLPALQRSDGVWDFVLGVGLATSLSLLYKRLDTVLFAAWLPMISAAATGAPSPAPHPALERLTTALAASAVLWLPEQARLSRGYLAADSDPWAEVSADGHIVPPAAVMSLTIEGVLAWVELLPFLPESDGAPSGGSPAAEAGAAASSAGR